MAPEMSAEANRYRIARLEEDVRDLRHKSTLPATQQKLEAVIHDTSRLEDDFTALRRALYTAALAFTGSTVLAIITFLIATRRG